MTERSANRAAEPGLLSAIRDRVGARLVVLVLAGVTAGYSLQFLTADAVSLPVLGDVPGPAVGLVGLLVAGIAYRRASCRGNCGSSPAEGRGGCAEGEGCGDGASSTS